jgi:ATP-dependent protease ClpP protease subunit
LIIDYRQERLFLGQLWDKEFAKMPIKSELNIPIIHEQCIDIENREMWIHGVDVSGAGYDGEEPGIEYLCATKAIKNLHILRKKSATKPIICHLHTCGGIYEEGMAIYDTIRMMPYKTIIVSYTHARSMSSIILQAGYKRLMLPNSYFMFHYGTLESSGEAKTVYSNVEFNKKSDETMLDIYVEKVFGSKHFKGKKKDEIREILRNQMDKKGDVFLLAHEAVEWGFADGIVNSWKDVKKHLDKLV